MSQTTSAPVAPTIDPKFAEKTKKVVNRAARIATTAHKGQKRKYSGLDYITHPAAVADIVAKLNETAKAEDGYIDVAAAYLHDVIEDCNVAPEWLVGELKGPCTEDEAKQIVQLVVELTKESEKPEHKSKPRAERKEIDRLALEKASPRAQRIKLADCLHNTTDILRTITETPMRGANFVKIDISYARKYLGEKLNLVSTIGHAQPTLAGMIRNRLLAISDTPEVYFANGTEKEPLGVFAEAIAVTKYALSCTKCKCVFELGAAPGQSVEGKELSCPHCAHKSIYLLVTADHK